MEPAGESGRTIRFGPFEADLEAGDLRLKGPTLKRRGCPFVASVAPVSSPAEAVAPLYERREESAVIDRRDSTRRVALASAALVAIVVATFALNLAGFRDRVAAAGLGLAPAPARPHGAPRCHIESISVHPRQCLTAAP